MFAEAAKQACKSNYEAARILFNVIITTYPDSPYLPHAKLAIADTFYLEGTTGALIQAAAGYQEWLTFFPTDPLADEVMLKVAESEMRKMGLPDRDTTPARGRNISGCGSLLESTEFQLRQSALGSAICMVR